MNYKNSGQKRIDTKLIYILEIGRKEILKDIRKLSEMLHIDIGIRLLLKIIIKCLQNKRDIVQFVESINPK